MKRSVLSPLIGVVLFACPVCASSSSSLLPEGTSFASQFAGPPPFMIDGIPVFCANNTVMLVPNLGDAGKNDGQGHIYLEPAVMLNQQIPTVFKLFVFAHECGHSMVGPNETQADLWAIQTGKAQGWFPPAAFNVLIAAFANNPGDWTHLPGPTRVQIIEQWYATH